MIVSWRHAFEVACTAAAWFAFLSWMLSFPTPSPSKQNVLENSARSARVDDEAKAEESRGPKP